MEPHIHLINPRGDTDFVAFVDHEAVGVAVPEELQARLRATYPDAVVRRRGLAGERIEVWYVYRDGHWTTADGS